MPKRSALQTEVVALKKLALEHEARLRELETEIVSLKARITISPPPKKGTS